MPDPNKQISSPTLDSCDRNVICTGKMISAENIKPEEKITIAECINPCAKETRDATASVKSPKVKKTSAKETKVDSAAKPKKKCKSVKEKPAVLNEECPPGPTCQMARPEITDPKARVDITKPGCIDFEKCDDDEEVDDTPVEKTATGCQSYEDCKDLAKEEKRRLKELKDKQKKKEKAQKVTDETPCSKNE